ncbi:MAG: hypothetical protein Q9191_003926, partial [Dirinaria sp. TL-2023a]
MATLAQNQVLLSKQSKTPNVSIQRLPSSPDDTEQVWSWNETQPALVYECAHALIKKQVDSQPYAPAVYAHDASFTFRQLDDLSNRLAHLLVELGVKPEDIVPLCFEKSAWAIVGIIGVIKAGAAFVFIDPSHPEDRRETMMKQVEAKVVISSFQQAVLWENTPTKLITVDAATIERLPTHDEAPSTKVTPSSLLYVIFTSGSTGTPKGCLIEHSAFCSGSIQHAAKACITSSSRVLQLASFVFDVSILEILTSLISGACICLPSTSAMMLGPAHLINDMKITWAFLTPSLAKMIKPSDIPELKTLALGGEPLSKVDVETWAGHLQLINGYGPSECSIAASGNTHMTPDTDPANIGWAVGGLCWIVDAEDHDRLVSTGSIGELLIEGPILARGYLKNKAKTDEVFVESPAWGPKTKMGTTRRLYKTGDLARFNPDGSIHFVGRKDTQVKLRGLRIELGDIEQNIANHDHIEYKMVILPKTGFLKDRLVAIVTLCDFVSEEAATARSEIQMLHGADKAKADPRIAAVRAHLATKVPEYMVPETWVVLETFPLLLSGKLNRSLVQKWIAEVDEATYNEITGLSSQEEEEEEEEEATALESQIQEIYAVVLNIPITQIRLSRSFLSLGGDSITAMQVMSRCRAAGIAITVKDLLRSKSINDLSACAGLAKKSLYSREETFETEFELSPVQRMYFDLAPEDTSSSKDMHFNQSFFLRMTKTISEIDLKAALQTVVAHHSMLRARFSQNSNGRWVQRVLKEASGAYTFAVHSVSSQQDAAPIMSATQNSLDIKTGPVFAVNLFQTSNEGDLLFLVAHHVMIDLVSWRTILRDLEEVLTTGNLSAEIPIPFQNWLRLQAKYEAQRSDLSTALPFTIPAPDFGYWGMLGKSNVIRDTEEQRFQLDKVATAQLLGEAPHVALRTEPLHLLLSSLIHSFQNTFSDRHLPALFREGHGREPWDDEIDISETVGWFTTMYPLYVEPEKQDDIVEIIKRVKDTSHIVPDNGRPYFASRYLNEAGVQAFRDHDQVEISFDYLGLYQQLERPDALLQQVAGYEATTHDVGPDVPRFALVEITAEMISGHMQFSFVFNRHMKNQAGLKAWISNCKSSLLSATEKLTHLQRQYSLADFPFLSLTYSGLDELLSQRLPQIGVDDVDDIESIYPCSPMQHGLLIAQSRSANGFYEYYHTMKVESKKAGELVDVYRLGKAWKKVVQRHPSLRTVFIESVGKNGLYDQVVLKAVTPCVQIIDCTDDGVETIFGSQEPITFQGNEVPHRLTICKTSTGATFCKLDINHAIVDGSSIANILGDLTLAYDGKISPKPGFPFEAYISYTLEHHATSTLGFWQEHLAGVKPCIFPAMAYLEDAAEPEKQLKIANVDIEISPAALTAFCANHNVTVVNLFQLAWAIVLRAYTETEDVCFGYLSTGRDAPLNGIEEGVGAFITMLICRLNFNSVLPLDAVLDKVAEDFTRSLPNQYCDLASIQHSLDLAGQPLFNTIMSFHKDGNTDALEDSSITVEGLHGHDPTEYALSVDVGLAENKVEVMLGYWTSEFTDRQVANISSTFTKALECIIQQSATPVKEIDIVSGDHLSQMEAFNANNSQKIDRCIHDIFREQVEANPDEEAICSWEGSWSYQDLDKASTRLAQHIVSLGAGPETIIPYCFPKSAWAIISMMAILKAGAAGVALDPGHPVNRLKGLAEEVDASIVLAAPQTAHLFSTFSKVRNVVVVEDSFVKSLPLADGPASIAVRPNNAAFVVFTSGTTGKPKGIVLEHSALCTDAAAMGPMLNIGPGVRMAQFAAYTFDVSLQDIVTTLQRGGTICVISDHQKMNNLPEGINSTRANWADVTSTVAGLLRPEDVPTLTRLNTGGEPLTREVVDIWAEHVDLYNLYGPAETTINHTCSTRRTKSSCASNIGKSYGAAVWIVEEHDSDRLVPLGCIGELLIEGPLLARHYLNEPEKTKAAFIENPKWVRNQPASQPRRFYKSGDLCSFNTDGSLNIVGRRDGQIKINGQRVELDEIMFQVQSRLSSEQQAIIDAMDIEEHARSKTLISYIYAPGYAQHADNGADISIPISDMMALEFKALQNSLAESLPRYMIPSMYIPISRVPMTKSAKMDRDLLRKMVSGLPKEQLSHYMLLNAKTLPPSTNMELKLQSLWSRILGVEAKAIGANDNFFSLGGDSVGAMKLVAAARAEKITIAVANIFASPVLSEMATVAKATSSDVDATSSVSRSLSEAFVDNLDGIFEEASAQCGIDKSAIQNCYPTTPLQEGLMALSMRNTGAYLAQKVFHMPSGGFDVQRFQKAWERIIQTEDILRTRIVHTKSSGSVQVILNTTTAWESATDLESYLAADLNISVQYGGPLMRLAIVEDSKGPSYFVWTAHHAVYDGWTVNLLFEKVAKMYSDGTKLHTVPYQNFIDYVSKVDSKASEVFWRAQFATKEGQPTGFPTVPKGYQASSKQTLTHSAHVSRPKNSTVTVPTVLRAAWTTVIATYSDSRDVVFGTTLSGRNVPVDDIDQMMGPTITTVPVRIALPEGNVLIEKYLENVQHQATTMMPYEQVGLQNLRHISPEAQSAIDQIQTLLVVQPAEASEDVPSFLDMEAIPTPSKLFDTYALTIECSMAKQGALSITARYDESIIPPGQMKRMLQQFEHVIKQFCEFPRRALGQSELLNPQDLQDITKWNGDLPQGVDAIIQDQIAKQIAQRPDAPAVCAWDGNLTFRELDKLSTALANHLVALGTAPEVKVGLCFDKSKWNIVSMFAILKAGGICVQLLPTYPTPRILSILEDIEASVVLVAPQHSSLFSGLVDNVVAVEESLFRLLPSGTDLPVVSDVRPENAAFIVFTSGSTGKPKGVMIEHRGFCTMTHYQSPAINLGPQARVLQFASHAFDICLFESFATLICGGCVCIPSEAQRLNDLAGAINKLDANWLIMVSTVADTFRPEEVPGVKDVVLGGEPLRSDIHARWAESVNLINDYGPAECSILAVMTASKANTPPSMIGRGLGCRTWVTHKDDHNILMPIGCAGELLVEGPLVARGYLKDIVKTEAAYIGAPVWAKHIKPEPARLYKTGDLVRYDEEGNLFCIGRKDTQIKIRGLRVELGEIEHNIKTSGFPTKHFAVERILQQGDIEKPALAAFIIPESDDSELSNRSSAHNVLPISVTFNTKLVQLRDRLSESLQSYMVPTLYVLLERMPETQTGKIDRKTLRKVGADLSILQLEECSLSDTEAALARRIPTSEQEKVLQRVWAEVLDMAKDSISADDSFFKKGGDSVRAMRLAAAARRAGLNITVANIFENPLLSDMALAVGETPAEIIIVDLEPFSLALIEGSEDLSVLVKNAAAQCGVEDSSIEDIYPCTPLQEGMITLSLQNDTAYMAQRLFALPKETDIERFKDAWRQVVALHPILRTRIVPAKNSGALQVVINEEILWQRPESLNTYLEKDKATPIGYGSPLVRFAMDPEQHHFIWTAHHALYDGFSANVIFNQVEQIYNGNCIQKPVPYTRFIKHITDVDASASSSFWKSQLGGGAPTSFPQPPSTTYQPHPDMELKRSIKVNRENTSGIMLSTILRAAWALVTAQYMDSDDVVFGTTLSGRNASVRGIEDIVAPTITTVPVRVQLDRTQQLSEYLAEIQHRAAEMIPYEHTGIQYIYRLGSEVQAALALKNLFVVQQQIGKTANNGFLPEVQDPSLLQGFHTYALVMECVITDDESIELQAQFDTAVLSEQQMARLLTQFEHVIMQLGLETSNKIVGDVKLFGDNDLQQILEWNNSVELEVVNDCVHNIFKGQVALRPNAEAVCAWDGSLTYAQLDKLSDKLASCLVRKGVQPEVLVPLCFDKSVWTVVTMLAVLKAGGACVHLGATQPIARLAQIISDTKARVLLADPQHSEMFHGLVEVLTIEPSFLESLSMTGTLPIVQPTNPAFVLFTSGSTGKPKGIVVEHGSLCTSSKAHGTNRKVGPNTRLLQFAAYTFDVSVADIFTTLQRGGCICVPSEDERTNDLAGAINRMNVNYGFLTPTVAGLLNPQDVPGLRRLILGGEMLTQDNIQTWAPVVDLIISYGMAECSIHCVDAVPLTVQSNPANLGHSSGCLMWIVEKDNHNKLAPIGCVGELVIEGRMVARGYLNDKAKTDAAFIEDAAWALPGPRPRRMYKTGDLAKYGDAGEICYVSRKDFQVKHHGQRIELGEIEHHLLVDSQVKHAVVLLAKTGYSQNRLVGILSLHASAAPAGPVREIQLVDGLQKGIAELQLASIRSSLAAKVPDYMVPAIWMVVQAIPLTANGKMDRVRTRQWLEEMDEKTFETVMNGDEQFDTAVAATQEEKRLQEMLSQVLNLPTISLNRSFLDLGGDSIGAMQLKAKCHAEDIELTVRDILLCSSISELALKARFGTTNGPDADEMDTSFVLSSFQENYLQDIAFADEHQNGLHQVHGNCSLLQLAAITNVQKIARATEAVVHRHPMLRARFSFDDESGWTQKITADVSGSYSFKAHSVASLDEILYDSQAPLNVQTGPLFAAHLAVIEQSEEVKQQYLFISVHPLVADKTSLKVITDDLGRLLDSKSMLTQKPPQFQAWIRSVECPTGMQEAAISPQTPIISVSDYWGMDGLVNSSEDAIVQSLILDAETTALLLGPSNKALRTDTTDILLSGLLSSFSTAFDDRAAPTVLCTDQSRKSSDANQWSGTVGCFTTAYSLNALEAADIIELVGKVKDSRIRASYTQNSRHSGLNSHIQTASSMEGKIPSGRVHLEILFDYRGQVPGIRHSSILLEEQSLLQDQLVGKSRRRSALIEVSAEVVDRNMKLTFTYNAQMYHQGQINQWIQGTEATMQQVAKQMQKLPVKNTLTDFPLLPMDYSQLANLETTLSTIGAEPANIAAVVPCSPIQYRMLQSQRRTPGTYQSDTWHIVKPSSESQTIDVQKLQAAWKAVIDCHEALRTIFIPSVIRHEEFDQVVLKDRRANVQIIACDESTIEATAENHHAVNYGAAQPHSGFTIFQGSEGSVYCKLEINHALQDGMSTRVIYRDLVLAYEGLLSTEPTPGFSAYISWLSKQDISPSVNYWNAHLADIQPCRIPHQLSLPLATRENKFIPLTLPQDLIARLPAFCKSNNLTMATVFQTAWALVLRTYTRTKDIIFGYMTANRDVPIAGIADIVGPLINMLLCRLSIPDSTPLPTLLRDVAAEFLEGVEHQYGLVEAVQKTLENNHSEQIWNSVMSLEYDGSSSSSGGAGSAQALTFDAVGGTRSPEFDVVIGVLI